MAPSAVCPRVDEYEKLLRGVQPPAVAELLAQHLEQCSGCGETVEQLASRDGLAAALRSQLQNTPGPPSTQVEKLIAHLRQLRPKAAAPNETADLQARGADTPTGADARPDSGELNFLAPPQGPDEIGRLGSYRVLKVLGAGGMGMVFQAQDVHLDRLVALKVMKPSIAANPAAKQRFLREAKACAALKHDHIVTVYQVAEDRGVPFLAMEFLEGMPLDSWLRKGRKLTPPQILRIGREIARGLAAAHDKGMIHRDIKPGNVWLDKTSGRIKILDFGLARGAADDVRLTQSGAIVGTPAYMAPEQARGDDVDARSDLFSLGCVLYELCTGQLPFRGESTMAVLTKLALDDPTPISEVNSTIPQPLVKLVDRLLTKKPEARPQSARAVVQEIQKIETALAGGPKVAAPLTATPVDAAVSPFQNLAESAPDVIVSPSRARPASGGRQPPERTHPRGADAPRSPARSRRGPLIAVAAALAIAGLAAGIWIIIRDSKGNKVGEVEVPDGGSYSIHNKSATSKSPPTAPETTIRPDNTPPPGFTALFNGKDLTGWQGLVPLPERAQLGDKLPEAQKAANEKTLPHWTVQNGVLHYDGKGGGLQTIKDYGDFELWVDWKIGPNGDTGIYLRGSPQVQIWDPKKKSANGVGSGGLFNNVKNPNKPDKFADKPIGEWNTFRILMKGDKVTVYLNGELVVDNVVMEGYWGRKQGEPSPPLPARGPIELQHFGEHLEFKNIYIKELSDGSALVSPPIQPPPLTEWLKGRTVLTVSQDGKGHFKSILEALKALKPGQVVKVLDRGPYREYLRVGALPDDTGLVSEQQTVLELPGWIDAKGAETSLGHAFGPVDGFRMSGFRLVAPQPQQKFGNMTKWIRVSGLVVEDCYFSRPAGDKNLEGMAAISFQFDDSYSSAKPIVIRNCLLHTAGVNLSGRVPIVVVAQNYFKKTILAGGGSFQSVVVRHNVFDSPTGAAWFEKLLEVQDTLTMSNNTLVGDYIMYLAEGAPRRGLVVRNNISESALRGNLDAAMVRADAIKNWQTDHNGYLRQGALPKSPSDVTADPKFLSLDPGHRDYVRVPADNPLATGGAGGSWPSYIGALPPGPAPTEGDWFTRLRQRWADLPAAGSPAVAAPLQVPEPPPLTEWLKGREILTVSQEGKGQFKAIQAALNALKPGQVVKVLDRGPYREYLRPKTNLPADCGLITDQQTVIEFPDGPPDWQPSSDGSASLGHQLQLTGGFRLYGFALTFPARKDGMGLFVRDPDGLVVENCFFRIPPGGDMCRAVHLYAAKRKFVRPAVIRECLFDGRLGVLSRLTNLECLVARNGFFFTTEDVAFLQAVGRFEKLVIRHNVFVSPAKNFLSMWEVTDTEALDLSNNTFSCPTGVYFAGTPPRRVRFRNNLFADSGGLQVPAEALPEGIQLWEIGQNIFRQHWKGSATLPGIPLAVTDRVVLAQFLSEKSTDPGYLRLPLDSPLATGGAGGAWPAYIGALPPGPAPKDGDWFTRLRQRWQDLEPTPQPAK